MELLASIYGGVVDFQCGGGSGWRGAFVHADGFGGDPDWGEGELDEDIFGFHIDIFRRDFRGAALLPVRWGGRVGGDGFGLVLRKVIEINFKFGINGV